jgi:hypothetical protein
MKFTKAAAVAALVLLGAQAHAYTWSISSGAYSDTVGAVTETFDTVGVDGHESLDLLRTGGGLFSGSISGVTSRPSGSAGNFLSVGTSGGQTGPIQIDLSDDPASYYGFLWGSPDGYNQVSFYSGNLLLAAFTGSNAFGSVRANGFQGAMQGGQYFNFFAGSDSEISRVVFASTNNAFETDNHAVQRAVSEPAALALILSGLGLVALSKPRRKG